MSSTEQMKVWDEGDHLGWEGLNILLLAVFLQFHSGSFEFVREHWEVFLLLVMDSRRLGRIGEALGIHQH